MIQTSQKGRMIPFLCGLEQSNPWEGNNECGGVVGWGNGKVFDGRVYTGWLIGKVLNMDNSDSHTI